VTMYLMSAASDRVKMRGPFVASVFVVALVGWVILLTVHHNNHARYFGCICIVIGGYCSIPLVQSWVANSECIFGSYFLSLT
jgi:hypothetical protein